MSGDLSSEMDLHPVFTRGDSYVGDALRSDAELVGIGSSSPMWLIT